MSRQQRIAREWLIFLGCVITGLFVTYFAIYANTPVYNYGGHNELHEIIKYKNPGDMFNVLMAPFRGHGSYRHVNDEFVSQWLLTLCPYFVLTLVRSIVWSVRTLQAKSTTA